MKTQPFHSERRRHLRASTNARVEFWILDNDGKCVEPRHYQGVADNIGKGGMELTAEGLPDGALPDLLSQQTAICVQMLLPTSKSPLLVGTRVVWAEPCAVNFDKCRLGLAFREISTANRDRIVEYVLSERIQACEPMAEAQGA